MKMGYSKIPDLSAERNVLYLGTRLLLPDEDTIVTSGMVVGSAV